MIVAAAVTFVVAMVALDARATYGARVTADEPQYLLTAISVAEDLNLDISDELTEQRYRRFHEVELNPQTIALDRTGQRLSPHDPLLPMLLAWPMAVGGWAMTKTALALVAAAAAAATLWLAARRFGVTPGTATWVTIALFCAPPLVGYATQIYPEMPAALVAVIGVAAVTGPSTNRSQAAAMAAVVALPWLAAKYAPVALVIALASIMPLAGRDRRRACVLSAVLVTAGVLYLVVHQRVYGGWTVYASGDHFVDGEFLVIGTDPDYLGRSRRLVGLLVDRGFGLIAWAPAYILLPPAVATVVRRRPAGWPVLISALAVGWAVATWVALTMHGWWWPGRQVVVVLPMAVVAMAAMVDRHPALGRLLAGGSLLGTFGWLWLVIEASTERRTLIVDFTDTTNPWYRAWSLLLPDHRAMETSDLMLTGLWILILGGASAMAWRHAPGPAPAERRTADADATTTAG